MRKLVLAAGALIGAAGYRLAVSGGLAADSGLGRRTRPLGPLTFAIAAPRTTVFDVIAAPYLGRTPRALAGEIDVLERGSDMVLAAHRTPVGRGIVATTIETVRFDRPETVDFRLLRGPVPHVVERFTLQDDSGSTRLHGRARHRLLATRPLVGRPGGEQVGSGRTGLARPCARRSRTPGPSHRHGPATELNCGRIGPGGRRQVVAHPGLWT